MFAQEGEANRADGAVTLLTNDELGRAAIGAIGVVHLVAIDKQDQVGILLNRARFPQVRHDRPLVGTLFKGAVELREGDDRHMQFFGQALQRTGDLGQFGGAVFFAAAAATGHQLQVVHHDQAQLAAAGTRQAAGTGTHLHDGKARGLVDEERGLVEPAQGMRQARPVIVRDPPGAQFVLVESPHRAQHPHDQLRGPHLHGEHSDRQSGLQRHILSNVERKGRLTHTRPARDDDEVTRLHPRGPRIEIGKPRGDAGDIAIGVTVIKLVDAINRINEERLDLQKTGGGARTGLTNLENLGLSMIENLGGAATRRVVGRIGNIAANRGQAAQQGPLTHDLGIAADVGCGRGIGDQGGNIGQAPHLIDLVVRLQGLGHGNRISRRVVIDETRHLTPDGTMVATVKIRLANQVGHPLPSAVVEHQSAQHRLLRLDGVRWKFQSRQFGIHCHSLKINLPLAVSTLLKRGGDSRGAFYTPTPTHDLRPQNKKPADPVNGRRAFWGQRAYSGRIVTVISTRTSECSARVSVLSPMALIGPVGIRT